jgi:hypothetical protein
MKKPAPIWGRALRVSNRLLPGRDDLRGHDLSRWNVDAKDLGPATRLRSDDMLFTFVNEDGLVLPEDRIRIAVADGGPAFDDEEDMFLDLIGLAARRFIAGGECQQGAREAFLREDGRGMKGRGNGIEFSDQWSHDDNSGLMSFLKWPTCGQ